MFPINRRHQRVVTEISGPTRPGGSRFPINRRHQRVVTVQLYVDWITNHEEFPINRRHQRVVTPALHTDHDFSFPRVSNQ